MSHLNEAKTRIKNQEAFIRALCNVTGLDRNQIEVHDEAVRLNGYHKEEVKHAHILIRQANTKIPSDIGWERGEDGYFTAKVDDYDYSWIHGRVVYDRRWQAKLQTQYNIETEKMALDERNIPYICVQDSKGRTQIRAKFVTDPADQYQINV